ncbi:MAG: DNA-3-methyladenine glycosylase I [Phycisphaerales bacterium JB040]
MPEPQRCPWAGEDPLYVRYHDEEWGVPTRDDTRLFEKLCLEGQQAGLSWITVLRKRERYRDRFAGFEIDRVARITPAGIESRLQDAGLIRHRGKLEAIVDNAKATRALMQDGGSLSGLLWSFVGGETTVNRFRTMKEIPASTPESALMSKALKKRGFRFVGPTTCYAMMQACGLVNDHLITCPRHGACQRPPA